ncbi:DUF5829 family protein [Amycolatopsis sp. YIM 10]|uniref:DUF5829 family protein n=1 Tax=Amycolatopsis sp. YIM 10 TaxID=2653857 RepID=UPI001D145742|nr:DUF5829 family protein [Amycolatopsis sp. YIM 10]
MLLRRLSRMSLAFAAGLTITLTGAVESQAGDGQLLYFNHAYGVLDRETADAIEHSGYLREFANFEVRTTTGADGRVWTGRYLLGRETYVELFGVGDLPEPDGDLGSAGLAVSSERDGDLPEAVRNLHDEGVTDPFEFLQTRDFGDGVPVPWFDGVFTTDQYDEFGAWGMEYRPEYFADPRSNTEPPSFPGDVGRERYLSDGYQDHLLRDVTAVHVAITEGDLGNTVPLLKAGGFSVWPVPGGVVAKGGGTTVRLDAVPPGQVGLRQLDFALNRPVAVRDAERIGNSELVVGPGSRAVWTFTR